MALIIDKEMRFNVCNVMAGVSHVNTGGNTLLPICTEQAINKHMYTCLTVLPINEV